MIRIVMCLVVGLFVGSSWASEEFPFVVQIQCVDPSNWDDRDIEMLGMGVLVSPKVVLTGAINLLESGYRGAEQSSTTPVDCSGNRELRVVRDLGKDLGEGEERIYVDHWIIHPEFRASNGSLSQAGRESNYALLILRESFSSDLVYPEIADLSFEEEYLKVGAEATVVYANEEDGWYELIQNTNVILDREDCIRRMWRSYAAFIPQSSVCWGDGGIDPLLNLGTPLLMEQEDSWVLVGVLGKVASLHGEYVFEIFDRVEPARDWIREEVQGHGGDIPVGESNIQVGDLVILTIRRELVGRFPAIEEVGFVAMVLEENLIDLVVIPREDIGVEIPDSYRQFRSVPVRKEICLQYYVNVPYDSMGLEMFTWRKMSDQ